MAAWALPIATAIVAMPFLLRSLGRDGYGAYILAGGYAALTASFGPLRGAAQRVSAAAASGAALPAAAGGAYLAGLITGTAALAASFLMAPVFLRFAGLDPAAETSMLTAIRLAAATALASHLTYSARGVLIGLERYGLYSAHVAATTVCTTIGMVLMAGAGYQAPGLMAWLVMASAFSAVAAVAMAHAATGVAPRWSWTDSRAVLRFGAAVVTTETTLMLYVLAERTLLTRAIGLGAVAELTIPLSLTSALQNALAAGAVVLLPRAGAASARGDLAGLRTIYARAVKVIVLVAVAGSAALAGASSPLIGAWIGDDFARQTAATVDVLLAAFAVNAIATPIWSLIEGTGRPSRNTVFSICVAIIGVGGGVLLAPRFGAVGIASARALAMVAVPPFVLLGERLLFGQAQRSLWSAVLLRVVPSMLVLVAAITGAQHLVAGLPLILGSGALAALFVAFHWQSGYFDPLEKQAVARLVGARV